MDILYFLDFYHDQINLYYKGNTGPKSLFGGVVTLIVGIIFILLVIGFGNDFFYRLNPSFLTQDIYPDNYKVFNLTNKNFPIAFRFEDNNGQIIDSEGKSFLFDVYHQRLKKINGKWEFEFNYLNYSKCKEEEFADKNQFFTKSFANSFCIENQNFVFGGNWEGDFIDYINISYLRCEEGGYGFSGYCNDKNTTDSFIQNITFMSLFIQNIMYDPTNYTNPFIKDFVNLVFQIDLNMLKIAKINLIEYISSSDVGWMMESYITESEISFSSLFSDYGSKATYENNPLYRNHFGTMSFLMERKQIKYVRVYTKIQSLAANIGGILKLATFCLGLITRIYSNLILDFDLSQQIQMKVQKSNLSTTCKKIVTEMNNADPINRVNEIKRYNTSTYKQQHLVSNVKAVNSDLRIKKEANVGYSELSLSSMTWYMYIKERIKSSICCFKPKDTNIEKTALLIKDLLDIRNILEISMSYSSVVS